MLTGLLASVMIGRWNCRTTMITGSLLVTIGLIGTAFSRNIIMVLIFYSVIAGMDLYIE
jgi:NADH:ubiquinone oxidoreductase subunit K